MLGNSGQWDSRTASIAHAHAFSAFLSRGKSRSFAGPGGFVPRDGQAGRRLGGQHPQRG